MSSEKKRGRLSDEEMRFIKQNCLDLTVDQMAVALNRTEDPIRRFIENEQLRAADQSDRDFLLSTLKSKYYYKELKQQLEADELEYFEHQWLDYYDQFNGDVTHSEEMQILEMLRTEILINRSMKDRSDIMRQIARLERQIEKEMGKDEEIQDGRLLGILSQQLASLNATRGAFSVEHEKLLTKKQAFMKDLKGTRDQRKKNAEDAKTNFTLWLKELSKDENIRKEEVDMEVNRIAAIKERSRLSQYHSFSDGMIDQPLLTSETSIDDSDSSTLG